MNGLSLSNGLSLRADSKGGVWAHLIVNQPSGGFLRDGGANCPGGANIQFC